MTFLRQTKIFALSLSKHLFISARVREAEEEIREGKSKVMNQGAPLSNAFWDSITHI